MSDKEDIKLKIEDSDGPVIDEEAYNSIKKHINNLSETNLNDYESLLLENDQDLYLWFSGAIKPPKHFEIIVKIISDTLR